MTRGSQHGFRGYGQGYDGYSMSVNARIAYSDGEKPKSKWTKAAILATIAEQGGDADRFRCLPVKVLRDVFLVETCEHHTSCWYNSTKFYEVEYDSDRDYEAGIKAVEKAGNAQSMVKKVRAKFLEWTGTRNYPKAHEYERDGEIRGNWFYYCESDGGREYKKSITARGFEVVAEL